MIRFVTALAALLAPVSPALSQKRAPTVIVPPPIVVTPVSPRPETFGQWQVENLGKGLYTASVKNDAGLLFGAICTSAGCAPFITVSSTCEEDKSYPILVNAPSAAFTAHPTCSHIGKLTMLIMDEDDEKGIIDALSIGGVVGFAAPMASGEFRVSRFSLTGGMRAYARAGQLAKTTVIPASRPTKKALDEKDL